MNIVSYTELSPNVIVVTVRDVDGNIGYNTYNTDSSPRPVKTIIEIDDVETVKWEWVD